MADPQALRNMARYATIQPGDTLLEIGAGDGRLTLLLAQKAKRVIAIEKDPRLAQQLHNTAPRNVEVITGDARQIEWPPFHKMVSNLPYSITTPLLFQLLNHNFQAAVLTVQREVAQRLTATPNTPEYGRLTIMAQHKARIKWMETLPPEAFDPPPEVHSAILHIQPRKPDYTVKDPELFQRLVRDLFTQRRKTLKKSLQNHGYPTQGVPHLDRRPGELAPKELAEAANIITLQTQQLKKSRTTPA